MERSLLPIQPCRQGVKTPGGTMNVVCSQCNATYAISDKNLPDKRVTVKCKKCDGRIVIEPLPGRDDSGSLMVDYDYARPEPLTRTTVAAVKGHPGTLLNDYPELMDFAPSRYAFADLLALNKKGDFKSRRNKMKIKMLTAVKTVLDRVLNDGERVLHVATGLAYYPAEIFLGNGWMTMLYNRYVLAATNHRLILINTNNRMTKPSHYVFQLRYDEIKKIGRGLFRTSLVLERKAGKRRIFTSVRAFLSAEMQRFLQTKIQPDKPLVDGYVSLENVCPACWVPLPKSLDACTKCGAGFKTPKKAMLRSLLLPGLGDIYLGHRLLGSFELLGSLVVWLIVLVSLTSGDSGSLGVGVFLLLFFNGFDALLTYHMAKKGYSLENKREELAVAGQALQHPT
jgi:predicted Zn finger-like uncharacterized protein